MGLSFYNLVVRDCPGRKTGSGQKCPGTALPVSRKTEPGAREEGALPRSEAGTGPLETRKPHYASRRFPEAVGRASCHPGSSGEYPAHRSKGRDGVSGTDPGRSGSLFHPVLAPTNPGFQAGWGRGVRCFVETGEENNSEKRWTSSLYGNGKRGSPGRGFSLYSRTLMAGACRVFFSLWGCLRDEFFLLRKAEGNDLR